MNSISVLPPQMISLKEKNDKWRHACMDALENIGRSTYSQNLHLLENYEMVRGKFIFSHYIDREDYSDLITALTKEFDVPSHLRHYDIISQVINTLSGEYQKRPDIFRAKSQDEKAQNAFSRQKTELLLQYVLEELTRETDLKLLQEGLDPNKQDFASEEEQAQYAQAIQERRDALTPPEIEKYMSTKWMDQAEIWAQHRLEEDKQRFNLPEMEKIEFEDMLTADRCFRHYYLTAGGYSQETWNPINTFYHKSPEVRHVEHGDYVGRVFYLSIPEIINRYGHKMTEAELLMLEEYKAQSYRAGVDGMSGWGGDGRYVGTIPDTLIPYAQYGEQKFVSNHLGFDPNNPEGTTDNNIATALGDTGYTSSANLFQVTEAYWMSQRKIGKFVYLDSETNKTATMLVDEQFKIKGVDEIPNTFMELGMDDKINTVTWTWVNQVWKGIKIGNISGNLANPIYIDIKPNEFQFKGDQNIYGAKLPVCGQVFSNRNAESMSLVDLMKPHQIGYNVAMNQLYEIMQREIGRFLLMDVNMIPSSKDWGGPGNVERFMLIAKQLGFGAVDSSPANTNNSNFAHIQPVDLDEGPRMMSRLKIAEAFEHFALKQVGITPQRLGSITASESATGTEQAVNQSYAQTESYFTNFSNYKRRCLTMNLEIAQYVECNKEEIVISFIRSDMSRAWTKIAGTDILTSEMGIIVADSQEVLRQIETMRQFAMQNNTLMTNPVDVFTVISSNSPAEIKTQLEASYKESQKNEQAKLSQQQQMAQQQSETAIQMQKDKQAFEAEENEKDRANERYINEVKAIGMGTSRTGPDADGSGIPDVLEIQKFDLELNKHTEDILFKKQESQNKQVMEQNKLSMERQKLKHAEKIADKELADKEKDREVERENMENDLQIERLRAKNKPKPSSK